MSCLRPQAIFKSTPAVHCLGVPGGLGVKNPPAHVGDTGLTPGLGGSHMPQGNYVHVLQLLSLCSTREVTATRSPRNTTKRSPCWPRLEKACAVTETQHSQNENKYILKKKKSVLSFMRYRVQALWAASPFYISPEFLYSGFTALIHTRSTSVEYFSCQYVISLTTLSFLKELFKFFSILLMTLSI